MRWRGNAAIAGLTATLALVSLYPALGQKAPQSILPPGFGEPDAPPPEKTAPKPPVTPRPAAEPSTAPTGDAVGEVPLVVPPTGGGRTPAPSTGGTDTLDNATAAIIDPVAALPEIVRPLDGVGLLNADNGGLAVTAYGASDGQFLNGLMMRMRAPIASRWMSITLRRALLSQTATPARINGADWVAARAWLLVRMGEADNARALVEGVDSGNVTPWLGTVAMQTALATADPAALCTIADNAAQTNREPAWLLSRAMCAGLSGEGGTASALVDQARHGKKRARGVDVLLAEKVMGVGSNTRRSISILWDDVEKLNAWRFGLATATGVAIPERLMATVGPQARAWQARAPLLSPEARAASADHAATLGVFSNAALVDLYGMIYDNLDPQDRTNNVATTLRSAYVGDAAARLSGLKTLWTARTDNPLQRYARLILGARAAAAIAPADGVTAADDMIAAMLSSGLDIQAARWAASVNSGSLGWSLLAVGSPRPPFRIGSSDVGNFRSTLGDDDVRAQFLFAALAGLGRLPAGEIESMARDYEVPIGRATHWSIALDQAVARREAGTVVLLCAVGMQTNNWKSVPAAQLYRIIVALRAVGLEPEARMIAAEALTRA
jgi:hypothetical protein